MPTLGGRFQAGPVPQQHRLGMTPGVPVIEVAMSVGETYVSMSFECDHWSPDVADELVRKAAAGLLVLLDRAPQP